jgi:hypothetical protein
MTQPSPAPATPGTLISIPSPQFCIVLVDMTTSATPDALKPTPDNLQKMIDAALEQVRGPFAASHGLSNVVIRIAQSPTDRATNEVAGNIRDTIPEAPGALAYHQEINGVPDMEFGLDLFSSWFSGVDAFSIGFTHELLEMLKDPGANCWASLLDGSGKALALEVGDPVQNTYYLAGNGVPVTNFVLANYFIPGSAGPWDALGVMQAQTDFSNGYGIEGDDVANVAQVGGEKAARVVRVHGTLTELQMRRKMHPYSRAHRRGARFTALPPGRPGAAAA